MAFRAGNTWVGITFDIDGRINDKGFHFGMFGEVATGLAEAAQGDYRGYEFGGAVIAAPSIFPDELSATVRNALVLKFQNHNGVFLPPATRAAWCRREG